ncbi:MAG TPA: lipopolysaccharide heptosyltransferase I [Terriglobales bacterium]
MKQPLAQQDPHTLVKEQLAGADPASLRLLVVRLSAMGDVIHGIPAIAALRKAMPKLQVGWLVEERWAELLCAHPFERLQPRSELKPLVDWVHISNFKDWRKELLSGGPWRDMQTAMREVRAMNYDIALDLQGAIRSALATRLSGAKIRIGSTEPREGPARLSYTHPVATQGTHVVEQALSLASAVAGEELAYEPPAFPQDPATESWADRFHSSVGWKPLAIVNPGAGWGAKCWPVESYGAVAKALTDRGMGVLVNHGPGEEPLAQSVRDASGGTAYPMKCSVGELIALTRRASLFVGGDTGPMHLAAALGVPVVALFGPTRPERNGPYATRAIVLRSRDSVDNSSHTHLPDEGLQSIEPQTVIAAVDDLMKEHNA